MNKFKNLPTTIAGDAGEEYSPEFCKVKEIKCYKPIEDASFPIDRLFVKNKRTYGLEIKTKPKMLYYPRTGMDTADDIEYMNMDIPIYVLFIDYISKAIYGNWVHKLQKNKIVEGRYTYYQLSDMKEYRKLTDEEVNKLKELSNNSYYK
jgi:uncharacterized protein (DUF779 family)